MEIAQAQDIMRDSFLDLRDWERENLVHHLEQGTKILCLEKQWAFVLDEYPGAG